MKVVENII